MCSAKKRRIRRSRFEPCSRSNLIPSKSTALKRQVPFAHVYSISRGGQAGKTSCALLVPEIVGLVAAYQLANPCSGVLELSLGPLK